MPRVILFLFAVMAFSAGGCSSAPPMSSASTQPKPLPPSPGARADNAESAASAGRRHAPATTGQGFDFYLLNLSWSPEDCRTHAGAAECAEHDTFVLHGLWPENADGSYPEHCSHAPGPADPSQYADLYPDPELLAHEWMTHGTCSGLSPDAYFSAERQAFHEVTLPAALTSLAAATTRTPAAILGLFTGSNPSIPASSFVLSCGNNDLTAVEVCLDKSLEPTACGAVRSCLANVVRIAAPESGS